MLRSIRPRIAGRSEAGRDERDGEGDRTGGGTRSGCSAVVERGLDTSISFEGRSKRVDREDSGERRQAGENRATGDVEIGLGRVPLVM